MCLDDCDASVSRRAFIAGATAVAALGIPASANASVPIAGTDVSFSNGGRTVPGRLFRPPSATPLPAILVAQGNPGFAPYLNGICGRIASQNYAVLYVDCFAGFPPIPKDDAERAAWREKAGRAAFWRAAGEDCDAGLNWLRSKSYANADAAAGLGFCGGGVVMAHHAAMGARWRSLVLLYTNARISASFRSAEDPMPDLLDVADKIKVPLQAHYGLSDPTAKADDGREWEKRLQAAGAATEFYYYADAGHGFMKEDEPLEQDKSWGYAPVAAKLAEERMMKNFASRLRT